MSDLSDRGISNELLQEILTAVKLINNITTSDMDSLLNYYIEAICVNLLTRTHRNKFVEDMKYLVIDLVTDKLVTKNGDNPSDLESIQSMSEAGRSISYGISNVIASRLNMLAQKQLDANENLVNQFKLLYKS